jgi:hypothetical protein
MLETRRPEGGILTTVVIGSYFEDEHVRRIRELDGRLRVLYREDLVPPPRWPGDHAGPEGWRRSPEEDEEFLAMLAEAEVLYDFPRVHVQDLTQVAPKLRWVQASMAGAGEVAKSAGLLETDVVVTTASGVYSGPLAEFVVMAMLQHAKHLDRLQRDKTEKAWRQTYSDTLEGKTLCVVGMGNIGRAIAERVRPFGTRILGVKRTVRENDPARNHADELYGTDRLHGALGEAGGLLRERRAGVGGRRALPRRGPKARAPLGGGARRLRGGAVAAGKLLVGARERHHKPTRDGHGPVHHKQAPDGPLL